VSASSSPRRGRRLLRRGGITIAIVAAVVVVEERSRTFSFGVEPRAALPAEADDATIERAADELLDRAHAVTRFGGCVLVATHDRVVVERCYGAGDRPAPSPSARFSIASLWKEMVGLRVHRLAREGRLRLDDVVARYLPELTGKPCADVTLAQLLSMTSGLPYVIPWTTNLATQRSSAQRTDADFLSTVAAIDLLFAPGTQYQYSNVGFGLLTLITARLADRPWRDVFRDDFAREGMTDTGYLESVEPTPPVERGYAPIRCGLLAGGVCFAAMPRWNYSMLPGGGAYSSVRDLFKWDRALRRLESDDPELFRASVTPPGLGTYASGWGVRTVHVADGDVVTVYDHTGEDPGYDTYFARAPDRGVTVIVLLNTDLTLAHARFELFDDLLGLALGRPYGVIVAR
jgi:CubicO group peptidase (beta-lactamase class C family)